MIELALQYGRHGYRRIAALLWDAGWQVNDKRVERLSSISIGAACPVPDVARHLRQTWDGSSRLQVDHPMAPSHIVEIHLG